MTPGLRAFVGAILGALITLVAHPASRPFILGATTKITASEVRGALNRDEIGLQPPHDLLTASLWVQLGFDKLREPHGPSPQELDSLIKVAEAGAEADSRNAFWHQALAVFTFRQGDARRAEAAWERGARSDLWKDFQSDRLLHTQYGLQVETGALQAWQYAVAYYSRSESGAIAVEQLAKNLLVGLDYQSDRARRIRYATLVNGDLLRTGGRSNATSLHGANLVELAAYPSGMTSTPSPKRLWTGQNQLLTAFQSAGELDRFERARHAFSETDAWRALVFGDESRRGPQIPAMFSIATSVTPIATLGITIAGLTAWALGLLIGKLFANADRFPTPLVVGVSLATGAGIFLLSLNWAATIAVTLSIGFLVVNPRQVRKTTEHDLGPLFTFVMLVISLAASAALALYIFATSAPAIALATPLGLPASFYERPALAGLSAVLISLIFIACPLYALVHRLPTPQIVQNGLQRAGAMMAIGGLLATVILAPLCVFFDRGLCDQLNQLVSNEPVYHLTQ